MHLLLAKKTYFENEEFGKLYFIEFIWRLILLK